MLFETESREAADCMKTAQRKRETPRDGQRLQQEYTYQYTGVLRQRRRGAEAWEEGMCCILFVGLESRLMYTGYFAYHRPIQHAPRCCAVDRGRVGKEGYTGRASGL